MSIGGGSVGGVGGSGEMVAKCWEWSRILLEGGQKAEEPCDPWAHSFSRVALHRGNQKGGRGADCAGPDRSGGSEEAEKLSILCRGEEKILERNSKKFPSAAKVQLLSPL